MNTITQDRSSGQFASDASAYFQAKVIGPDATLLVAILKSFDSLCFDRTLDREAGLFEFFVTPAQCELFLSVMRDFEQRGVVANLRELPNRLLDPSQQL